MTVTAYTIRPFPGELHRRAKATAALEGITLKELILKALTDYIDKREKQATGVKPTLEELLQKWEEDAAIILGPVEAKRLAKWREFKGNYPRLIPFVQWRLRSDNKQIARRLDKEGGLTLERIALDYYPEFFNAGDLLVAKKTLGIEEA
jgi:hypothetical protein